MPRSKTEKDRITADMIACLRAADIKKLDAIFERDKLKGDEVYEFDVSFSGGKFTAIQAFCILSNPANVSAKGPEEFHFYDKPPLYLGRPITYPYSEAQCKSIIKYLMRKKVSLDDTDPMFGQTAVSTAIGFDNTNVALVLIEVICELGKFNLLNDKTLYDEISSTPLLISIQKGNKKVFDALLSTKKVNINKPDIHGLTPLHWAVIMGLPEMVEELVRLGANPQAKEQW